MIPPRKEFYSKLNMKGITQKKNKLACTKSMGYIQNK